MYPASARFKEYIKKNTVSYSWHGTIVDTENNSYSLTSENIVQHSGSITKRCSNNEELQIGSVCASELEVDLYLDVDRYKLFGGVVTLYFTLNEGENDQHQPITEDVPMGIFTISECNQAAGKLNILAYDNMLKFDDVPFYPTQHTTIQAPFQWLFEMCTECGVELGMTSAQILALPNGGRKTGFADVTGDVKTWRDVLKYLAAYLGGYAYIGRDGKLYIGSYKITSTDTISSSFRYSSNLSDFRTTYDGVYATYKEGGIQEYVANSNTGGLVLDLGINPFLQFSDESNRLTALGEIINAWNGIYYVPFDSDMPLVPIYDVGDVLTFTDNQASIYDIGAITEITYSIGSQMHVMCSGDNPRLASAQDRFSKSIAGLSADYNNGQQVGGKNFWLLHTENTSAITVDNTKVQVAEIEWNQTVDVQRMGFMFTCEINLNATAIVDVLITVDDSENYEFECTESKAMIGKRIISSNCGFRVTGKGTHTAKVYLTATDSPLIWNDLV